MTNEKMIYLKVPKAMHNYLKKKSILTGNTIGSFVRIYVAEGIEKEIKNKEKEI